MIRENKSNRAPNSSQSARRGLMLGGLLLSAALIAAPAAGQSGKIGGFDLYGPNAYNPDKPKKKKKELANEVIVSQSADSKVRTVAEAMKLVKPNGRILVEGGPQPYAENIQVLKSVEIRGIEDAYGREAVFRPSPSAPCVSIAPDTPLSAVTIKHLEFEINTSVNGQPCIDISGGTVKVVENLISPIDVNITRRSAFRVDGGPRPLAHWRRLHRNPPRDPGLDDAVYGDIENLYVRHGVPVGAGVLGDSSRAGPVAADRAVHAQQNEVGAGRLNGPAAGVRVTAGNATIHQNVIIGAQQGVAFVSTNGADISGDVTMNHIAGNSEGIVAVGAHDVAANLVLSRNTMKFNREQAIRIDVTDGIQVLANEIIGNEHGILLSENVLSGTINSNMVYSNRGDAMRISSNFTGVVSGNTFAYNDGCTVQFFSAEQRWYNRDVKLMVGEDFTPGLLYATTNGELDNFEDLVGKKAKKKKRGRRSKRDERLPHMPPACGAPL